jgi:hypothetical protein
MIQLPSHHKGLSSCRSAFVVVSCWMLVALNILSLALIISWAYSSAASEDFGVLDAWLHVDAVIAALGVLAFAYLGLSSAFH